MKTSKSVVLFLVFITTGVLALQTTLADTPYFVNVAGSAGVADRGSGNGAAWIDYDNDGDLDLYFVNAPGSGGFYRNNLVETGSATFTQISVGVTGYGCHPVTADYDNDGWIDIVLGSGGNAILYRNTGTGTFVDVTASSGISVSSNSFFPIWGNYYDQDGKPDLYFGDIGKLYKNNGDGTFTDTTSAALLSPPERARSAWIDYDNDSYDDLFIAPLSGDLILYHNKGDGTFEDVSVLAGINLPSKDLRIAVGDYNGDAYDDIYVFAGASANYLFRNNQDATFSEVALAAGVKNTAGTGHCDVEFFDFDLDGDLDLYANGYRYGSNNFFLNNGDGTFTDITALTGLSNTDDTHDIAIGDFNGDGLPDIYEATFTGYGSSANKLFLNTFPAAPPPTDPPIADAGDDIIASANEEVTLDGSNSYDPDGEIIKYTWKRLPDNVVIYSGKDPNCQTRALGRAEEVIELTVTDNYWATATDTVRIVSRTTQDIQDQVAAMQSQIEELQRQIQELQALVDKIVSWPPIRQWLRRTADAED